MSLLRMGAGRPFDGSAGGGEDAATTAWVAAVVGAGGTVSGGRRTVVNTLIAGLRSDGVWAALDRLWLLAAENTQSALIDLVATATATANGSPTVTTDRGYTGADASTTQFINTGFNPTTATTPNYVQNSAHISIWSNTNGASTSGGGADMGLLDGSTNTVIISEFNDGNAYFRANDNPASGGTVNSNSLGHYIANRSGASASQSYLNGSSFATPNATSGTVGNGNFYILAFDQVGTGATFGSGRQISAASIGGSLSSGLASSFYTRLRSYMTSVGVP